MFQMNRARTQARKELGGTMGRGTTKADDAAVEARALEIIEASRASAAAAAAAIQHATPANQIVPTGNLDKPKDMSDKLLSLNRRLRKEKELGNEREVATLQLMVRRQEIEESNLEGNKKTNALEQATLQFRQEIFDIDKKAADLAERERKKREADEKKRREADPGFKMKKQLEELLKLENQVAAGATAIGNAFANSFKGVITGSKSAQEALADMMASVAEHFIDMAAQIIAQQLAMILYGTVMKALGVTLPGGGGNMGGQNYFDPTTGKGVAGPNFGLAEGGYVSGPTNALVGEGGEPEYIIPESKMRESMARYSRGARGGSVIPESGAGGTSEDGGTAVTAPIDVRRFSVERINSVDYVTASEFQQGLQQAAAQGAQRGEQQTLRRLQMSSSTRRRIGV